jgi:hypothetical protein
MPQVETMPLKERLAIGMKSIALEEAGQIEEASRVLRQIPLPAYLAKFAKEKIGVDFLIQQGFNLSEADAEYGPGWLTR